MAKKKDINQVAKSVIDRIIKKAEATDNPKPSKKIIKKKKGA
jgi:hypothetical protein